MLLLSLFFFSDSFFFPSLTPRVVSFPGVVVFFRACKHSLPPNRSPLLPQPLTVVKSSASLPLLPAIIGVPLFFRAGQLTQRKAWGAKESNPTQNTPPPCTHPGEPACRCPHFMRPNVDLVVLAHFSMCGNFAPRKVLSDFFPQFLYPPISERSLFSPPLTTENQRPNCLFVSCLL